MGSTEETRSERPRPEPESDDQESFGLLTNGYHLC